MYRSLRAMCALSSAPGLTGLLATGHRECFVGLAIRLRHIRSGRLGVTSFGWGQSHRYQCDAELLRGQYRFRLELQVILSRFVYFQPAELRYDVRPVCIAGALFFSIVRNDGFDLLAG